MFCPNCGTMLENKAKFCPNCGKPIEQSQNEPFTKKEESVISSTTDTDVSSTSSTSSKKPSILKRILYGFFCVIAFLALIRSCNPDNNILGIDDMREAYSMAQEIILENISTPQSAKFPKFEPEFVTQRTEVVEYQGEEFNVRTVSSYVDYENIFGTVVRSNYVIVIGKSTTESSHIYYEILEID